MNDQEYLYLSRKIFHLTGIDLSSYKVNQMRRRLSGFVTRNHCQSVIEYCRILESDAGELARLRDFLTINVTEFFRDSEHYKTLKNVVLPGLMQDRKRLNIWSAGCSTGAEPYSIAIILDHISPGRVHKIVASDMDTGALERAAAGGPYKPNEVKNVEPHLLGKYFTQKEKHYWVCDGIRRRVEFRQQNLLKDRFDKGIDLLVCRNVTIYFSDEAQSELYKRFYNSLSDGGILFIGGTETMLCARDLPFEKIASSFYRKPATPIFSRDKRVQVVLTG